MITTDLAKQKRYEQFADYFNIRKLLFRHTNDRVDDAIVSAKLNPSMILHDLGIVNMDFGRQTGSSYFLREFIKDVSQFDPLIKEPQTLVLFNSIMMAHYTLDDHIKDLPPWIHPLCAGYNDPLVFKERLLEFTMGDKTPSILDYIIVDTSSMLTDESRDYVFKIATRLKPKMIILL